MAGAGLLHSLALLLLIAAHVRDLILDRQEFFLAQLRGNHLLLKEQGEAPHKLDLGGACEGGLHHGVIVFKAPIHVGDTIGWEHHLA